MRKITFSYNLIIMYSTMQPSYSSNELFSTFFKRCVSLNSKYTNINFCVLENMLELLRKREMVIIVTTLLEQSKRKMCPVVSSV